MVNAPEKTVRFYALYAIDNGKRRDPQNVDWHAELDKTVGMSAAELKGDGIVFDPRAAANGRLVLGVHKPIDTSFMTALGADGSVEDLLQPEQGGRRFAHSSAAAFLDGWNVVALVKGERSAPGPDAVGTFLDQFMPLDHGRWQHEPVIDTDKVDKLRRAQGATKFSATFTTARTLFTEPDDGFFDLTDGIAAKIGGDVEVEITVRTVPEASSAVQSRFKGLIERALPRLSRHDRPKVTAVFSDGFREELDLIGGKLSVTEQLDPAASERARFSDLIDLVSVVGADYEDRIRSIREGT